MKLFLGSLMQGSSCQPFNVQRSNLIFCSYVEAKELALISLDYIGTLGNSSNNTMTAYFSTNPAQNVTDKLQLVADENDPSRTSVHMTYSVLPG